jgi:ABC-type protease/lipase transport system fused ATPase/permease subunit
MSLPKPSGQISVRQIFLTVGQARLLQNISFDLAPGELLGIIGPSGAGKSTLCRVLTGIWPTQGGGIRLDGVDLFYWNQEELGAHVGYLAQEVALFNASVAKNIARMGDVDGTRVSEAANAVYIHDWIQSLPKGYDTVLDSSDGIALSGGQRQRIALARAMYGNPKLLVFDEPNSNLDTEGEKALIQLLANIKQKRSATCVIVTHKPEILDVVDKILLLKDGQAAAFGPKNQVLTQLANSWPPSRKTG